MNENFGPVMKRVVNVKKMNFNTDADLHNFQPAKNVDYAKTVSNRKLDPNLYNFMRQTSELDLDENFTIRKMNPLFQNDESYNMPESNEKELVLEPDIKKTPLELMFEQPRRVSKIDVVYEPKNKDTTPEINPETYCEPDYDYDVTQSLNQSNTMEHEPDYNKNDGDVYEAIPSEFGMKNSFRGLSLEKQGSFENDDDNYSISNFDAISMSSYTIQERKNSEITSKVLIFFIF